MHDELGFIHEVGGMTHAAPCFTARTDNQKAHSNSPG
jgi:hypothetical protein